eukprot:TRINITY_DN9884_c0_g1_i3.p2 TRINITY_DN9884_c0_g1~~TRINITY_DN9884_c0_g1_i3.p2  ORF type:complete len:112 (+),score=31.93 TRINITY_DN9884_c0_g1_i3:143-478(+)
MEIQVNSNKMKVVASGRNIRSVRTKLSSSFMGCGSQRSAMESKSKSISMRKSTLKLDKYAKGIERRAREKEKLEEEIWRIRNEIKAMNLSLIHICRCRRYAVCRSRWSPYH